MKTLYRVQTGGMGKTHQTYARVENADAYAVQCSLALGGRTVYVDTGHLRKAGSFRITQQIAIRAEVVKGT